MKLVLVREPLLKMTNHPNRGRKSRPITHLEMLGGEHPNAWLNIDKFRQGKGRDLPDWPEWCFLPMAAWIAIASDGGQVSFDEIECAQNLAAIGTWRYSQSIYRLDSDLYSALIDTVPKGNLPVDVFYRLPEWSLYIETPNLTWMGDTLFGFWVHLEFDINTQRHELRFLLDTNMGFASIPVHLGRWTITEAFDRVVDEAAKEAKKAKFDFAKDLDAVEKISRSLYAIISLTLYVCSDGVEYRGASAPSNPAPKRTAYIFYQWRVLQENGDL